MNRNDKNLEDAKEFARGFTMTEEHARGDCQCGRAAGAPAECPFKAEIEHVDELCNCCDVCRRACELDI